MTYREPSELFPQPPDSTPDFAAMRAKRKKRALTLAVPLAVGLAVVGVGAALVMRRSAQDHFAVAAADARACLLEGALDPGETAPARFRRLQLQGMGIPEGERFAAGAKAWPVVCAGDVRSALSAASSAGVDDAGAAPLAELAKRLDDPSSLTADLGTLLGNALGVLERAKPSAPRAAGHLPRLAQWPLSTASLGDEFRVAKQGVLLGHAFTEENPGQTLPILIDEKDLPESPLLCAFTAKAPQATCRTLHSLKQGVSHGLALLGTTALGADPLIFAGKRGTEGVFTSKGELVDTMYSYGGYVDAAGNVAVLGFDQKKRKLVLSRKPVSAPAARLVLEPSFRVGNFFYSSQILWDQVLVRGVTRENERRLFVMPLGSADSQGFQPADVGVLPEAGEIVAGDGASQQHLAGCRTDGMTVVRVHGWTEDYLTFRFGEGAFSAPVAVASAGTLGCHGSTANLVAVDVRGGRRPLLQHDVCTSAGCVQTAFASDKLDRNTATLKVLDEKKIAAVDVMGKLLVVWSAGDNAGLRMRLGAPDSFERATDSVVFDDHWHDGTYETASTLLGFRLFSRESVALLLLSTTRGLHALRIDPDGTVTPWKVHHEG